MHCAFYCKLCLIFALMKKTLSILIFTLIFSCQKNDDNNVNCNFLLSVPVNASINLNLPQYNQLNFINNPVYVSGYGNKGLIINRIGANSFVAFDAADPNHTPSSCSTLEISGIEGTCKCDDANSYSLFTGEPLGDNTLSCALKAYRAELLGDNVIVTN